MRKKKSEKKSKIEENYEQQRKKVKRIEENQTKIKENETDKANCLD